MSESPTRCPKCKIAWGIREAQGRTWHGDSCERVVEYMDAALGPLPAGQQYTVIEGAA